MPEPPDIVLLAGDWQPRALIRAQLIEEGFEVVATNTWSMMRRHLRPGSKPRLAILDLKGLPDSEQRLHDVRVLMNPARVLILSAAGTIPARDIERLEFHTLSRPVVIEEVVRVAKHLIRSAGEHAAIS